MLAQPVSPPSSGVCKPTKPTIAQINRRVALAHERAQKAVALADTTALNENAQLVRAGVKRTALVSVRMSSKGFGGKDPRHALKILRLLSVDAMEAYTFAMLGLTSHKYHVSTLATKLTDASASTMTLTSLASLCRLALASSLAFRRCSSEIRSLAAMI